MKETMKLATIWGVMISIVVIFLHQMGHDLESVILIKYNPILSFLSENLSASNFMNSGIRATAPTASGTISIFWYVACVITWAIYGAIIDLIRYIIRNQKEKYLN